MTYEFTSSQGSFTSWGSGFRYHYEAHHCAVQVTPKDENRALARLKLGSRLAKNPLAYVQTLNKTNKIKALMYSDNATTSLADTMDPARLESLITITGRISRLAHVLSQENFGRFSMLFCQDFNFKSLKIKKFSSLRQNNKFYLSRLITQHGNSVCVRSETLSGLVANLSDKILCDLIALEFGINNNRSAQNLLSAASKLATIGRVLDQNFIPEDKLKRLQSLKEASFIHIS